MDWGIMGQLRLKEKAEEVAESAKGKRGTHKNIRSTMKVNPPGGRKASPPVAWTDRLPARESLKEFVVEDHSVAKCKFCDFEVPQRWTSRGDSNASLLSHMRQCRPDLFKQIKLEHKLDSFVREPLGVDVR